MSQDASEPSGNPITILLADDHRFFRSGVRTLLETEPGFTVIGEASSGDECVEMAQRLRPRVILMDVQMPGINGMEATRRVAETCPGTRVIILSMFEDTNMLLAAVRAGARGYILKDASEDELIGSIRAADRGEVLLGPQLAQRLLGFLSSTGSSANQAVFPELSDREREILAMLSADRSNHEIAQQLSLSLKTVRNHVSNILNKIGAQDRQEAARRARDAGLQ